MITIPIIAIFDHLRFNSGYFAHLVAQRMRVFAHQWCPALPTYRGLANDYPINLLRWFEPAPFPDMPFLPAPLASAFLTLRIGTQMGRIGRRWFRRIALILVNLLNQFFNLGLHHCNLVLQYN
jgi:hypothetical protein